VFNLLEIAASINVLAAQRFGEEFGVQDSVETCPIPTSASHKVVLRLVEAPHNHSHAKEI
jgi:hypothetical protein